MLSVINGSTMVLSKRWRDVISDKRKHYGFIKEVFLSKRWRDVISDKRKRITLGCRCRSFNLSQAATTFE